MTPHAFRRAALSHPQVVESEHMGHPDFRWGGKIFATLSAPDEKRGMVKLTPEQQSSFMASYPDVFIPCAGAWGRSGSTFVDLAKVKNAATKNVVKSAIDLAYENLVAAVAKPKSAPSGAKKRAKRGNQGDVAAV